MIPATSIPTLMHRLATDPGRPRLTWYEPNERIELSGRVLDNWVTKTANFLVEEFDAGPDTRVLVDLGPHWRAVVWALATWRTGSCVVLPSDTDPAEVATGCDIVVTYRPEHYAQAREVVAVPLAPLARSWDGALPAGALDGAAAVMSHGDVLTWMPETDPDSAAVEIDGTGATFAHLFAWANVAVADGERRLVTTTTGGAATALAEVLATYLADGSVVLCDPGHSAALAADPAALTRLAATERIGA